MRGITFSVRALLVIEREQRTVPNDWIGGGSEDTVRVAVGPNDVSRNFCHLSCPSRERPRMRHRGREVKRGTQKLAMCERTSSLIVVNQPLTQTSQPFPLLLPSPRRDGGWRCRASFPADYFLRL